MSKKKDKKMKRVITHWVQIEEFEVPEDCPTGSDEEFLEWLYNTGSPERWKVDSDSRDWEIVLVEYVETENKANGRFG